MTQATIQTPEKMPWGPQSPRGVGKDSNELLYTQQQSYGIFYHNSAAIQDRSREAIQNIEAINNEPLVKAITKITTEVNDLKTWGTDSYGCPAPSHSTGRRAENWITRLYFQVAFQDWIKPNVTAGSEGEVVFEWWYGVKKLTIYVSNQGVEYVQVWGTDIYEEMSDGDAEPIDTCIRLWLWLKN